MDTPRSIRFRIQGGFAHIRILILFVLFVILGALLVIGMSSTSIFLTINPLEQINKSKDSAILMDATELSKALQNFFTDNGCYPWDWQDRNSRSPGCRQHTQLTPGGISFPELLGGSTGSFGETSIIPKLIATSKLSPNFSLKLSKYPRSGSGSAFLSSTNPTSTGGYIPMVAIQPYSKAYSLKASYYNSSCSTSGPGSPQYICIPGSSL